MFIRNKTKGLIMVPLVPTEGTKEAARKVVHNYFVISPGINEVDDNEFAVGLPHLQADVENGRVDITQPMVGGKEVHSFTELGYEAALALINECIDQETLIRWFRISPRDELRADIRSRWAEVAKNKGDITDWIRKGISIESHAVRPPVIPEENPEKKRIIYLNQRLMEGTITDLEKEELSVLVRKLAGAA